MLGPMMLLLPGAIPSSGIAGMNGPKCFSSARAEAELGYRARPYREALVDAVDWFRKAGMIG